MESMTVEELCCAIYKYTFAHTLYNGEYAAHVFVRMRRNPFGEEVVESAFRQFVRNTPLSNIDLFIKEDPDLEEGVMVLDSIELFGDGESLPETIPFHKDVRKVILSAPSR